ncbi:MAG TPA: YraN family protein [Planctomycetota bacterium]|nr:YraN family protein [Planctomycetota bacterium]
MIALAPRTFLRVCEADREELGLVGEELAARLLVREGWRVLGRRVATPAGEVDLWAVRDGVCACVEVKAGRLDRLPAPRAPGAPGVRRGPPAPTAAGGSAAGAGLWDLRWRPGLRVDRARIARLARCARFLAASTPRSGSPPTPRVDLIEVLIGKGGRALELRCAPGLDSSARFPRATLTPGAPPADLNP